MGEMSHERPIRLSRKGPENERFPTVSRWERLGLVLLGALGVESILFFADYWFRVGTTENRFLYWLLVFAVFWNPLRNVYNWWVYMWVKEPNKPPAPLHPGTAEPYGSADVLTTAMPGEPYAMFERTLTAIAAIRYPHRSFLLDGGDDPALAALCDRLGVVHVDCRGIGGAKAGKMNHCLRNFSRAEHVLIIDPDHIPKPDFFDRVLPFFADADVGFVQVVQAYYNVRESFTAWAAAEQTFGFYGPTLMGLHSMGIPTAIGANCTFRRAALDSIGGHAEHLAEDALTSMRIHAEGWRSVYLPWRGSEGLSPSEPGAFFKQQLKWATGMWYLLFHEYPKNFRKLSPVAKLHYLVSGTYYLGGIATTLTIWLPIFFLFFQIYAIRMPFSGFLIHIAPYAIVSTLIFSIVQMWYSHKEERGFAWRSAVLEKATWNIYLSAFLNAVQGRKVPYLPTPKEGSGAPIPRLVWPHWLAIVLSALAIAWVPLTYHRIDDGTVLMVFFAAINIVMLLPVSWIGIRGLFRRKTAPKTAKLEEVLA
jgi:cellulose synthase (UDP-forming)